MDRKAAAFVAATLALTGSSGAWARADMPPIRIGIIQVLSGPQAGVMKPSIAAPLAYQKLHGDTIAGRKIEIIVRDEGGPNPEVAKRLAQELIVQDHVDFIVGPVNSANAAAIGPVSAEAKVPMILINSPSGNLLDKTPFAVRLSYTDAQTVVPLATWARRNGITKAYAIFLDYGPGIDGGSAFEKAFTTGGGTIVGERRVPLTNIDYSAYVQRIKDAKPQAILAIVSAGGGGRAFLKAFSDAGLDKAGVKVLASSGLTIENQLPALGDLAEGVYATTDYALQRDSTENREAIAAITAIAGEPPDFGAIAYFDAMHAIYAAVAAQHGALDPNKSLDLLRHTKFISPRGPIAVDPESRDIVQNVYIVRTQRKGNKSVNALIATFPAVRP
ncbi:MAG: ABC transporter substrate-binding protein [Candidatus Tumulicola sp.]